MTTLQQYLEKFRPIVVLHSDEKYYPIKTETYISQCSLITKIDNINSTVISKGNITDTGFTQACEQYGPENLSLDCSSVDWENYKDNKVAHISISNNDEKDPYNPKILQYNIINDYGSERKLNAQPDIVQYPCYYMVRNIDGNTFEIFYVFLYGYNDPYRILGCINVGAHQADWEGIIVRFDKEKGLLRVYYKAHGDKDGYWLSADKCPMINMPNEECKRLVFYSAKGSHGSYTGNADSVRMCNNKIFPRILCCANDVIDDGQLLDTYLISALNNIYMKQPIAWGKWSCSSPYWPYEIKDSLTSNNWFRRLCCFMDCCNPAKYLTNGDLM
jgi:hypothetical protein